MLTPKTALEDDKTGNPNKARLVIKTGGTMQVPELDWHAVYVCTLIYPKEPSQSSMLKKLFCWRRTVPCRQVIGSPSSVVALASTVKGP